jgi:signal transduction histidine kinase
VEDSGPGIPESESQAIFEPFRQLASGQPHSPGVGIGLSLVARFTEIHGGRAWVEDRPGGGASFRVYLPGRSEDRTAAHEEATVTETARA